MNLQNHFPYRDGALCCEGASLRAVAEVVGTPTYRFVMVSNYNSRPRATEGLVDDHRFTIVRRRETFEDLVAGETTV